MGDRIESFEDLEVYQLALELQQEIFALTKAFPAEEKYSLTDQIRRSSRSIGANISEAWGKRQYPAHFVSKLSDSDGEQNETRHWLRSAFLCKYISELEFNALVEKCKIIGRKLGNMMQHPDQWIPKGHR
ncbi:MAG: four helix bundle protein [Kiritimatiellaceae bacterium]|jgi:four helix bundle protein|nr:four helix bundle protein [Kiritimatiellaceae bacterium]